MKRLIRILPVLVLMLASCVHEYPTSVPTDLSLKMIFDRSISPYDTLIYDTRTRSAEAYDVRYVVEAFRCKPGSSDYYRDAAARAVYTKDEVDNLDHEVIMTVPDEGHYVIKVWTDFVEAGSQANKFYNADNFGEVVINEHVGNSEYRDAYIGSTELEVIRYGSEIPVVSGTVQMYRPLGRFQVISNDLSEFVEKETKLLREKLAQSGQDPSKVPSTIDLNNYVVRLVYNGFMPSAFNMHTGRPNDSSTGVFFDSSIIALNEEEALLGFDYVLAQEGDASVTLAIVIYDKLGNELSSTDNISVPLRRSMLTTIKGNFLIQESSGGVSINPDFDGEFNIQL